MLSHWRHSTGHLVIRVCCAATATNYTLTQTWAQALAHRHNHTLTAKVTVTRSFKVDARSIVKVTRVPSCSSLHKSQLIFWCARAWKLLKKSKEDLSCFIFDIDVYVSSLKGCLGFAWRKREKKSFFFVNLKAAYVFDIHLSKKREKCVPVCNSDNVRVLRFH